MPDNAPHAPGWYAFEGERGIVRKEFTRCVVEVLEVLESKGGGLSVLTPYGGYSISAMAGKWTRLTMPWETDAPYA